MHLRYLFSHPWLRRSSIVLAIVVAAWLLLAWRSGLFLPSDTVAVAPGQFTADGISSRKRIAHLPHGDVAYLDEGSGPVVVLLHGCPFSVFEWRDQIPRLTQNFRVIAPDLRGLGDTPVRLDDDYRLPTDAVMVKELLKYLGIAKASFIAHDHGGATLQLLMTTAPELIERAVMSNVEAYDMWPSKPELPYLKLIVNPITSPLVYQALKYVRVRRHIFSIAVHDKRVLSAEVLAGYTEPHIATPARWQRLRRFFRWQLDAQHNQVTMEAVPAMKRFNGPVLLIWGARDTNFGPALATRLARDIPGAKGILLLEHSSHMPMQEQPEEYAEAVMDFLLHNNIPDVAAATLSKARNRP